MPVSPISAVGFTPFVPQVAGVSDPAALSSVASAGGKHRAEGPAFGDLLLDGLDRLEGLQDKASQLSVQAATGDLQSIHDYTVAATEASVTTQVTVAVRNKAVEAFNEIMRMQV